MVAPEILQILGTVVYWLVFSVINTFLIALVSMALHRTQFNLVKALIMHIVISLLFILLAVSLGGLFNLSLLGKCVVIPTPGG